MKTKLLSLLFIVFLCLPVSANIRSFYGQNGSLSGDLDVAGDVQVTGNAYITGTANISAGLIVDTDTLTVDQSTNRVGIRTTTPQKEFSVVGDVQVTGSMFIDASTNEIAGEFVVEGAVGIYTANVSGGTIWKNYY